MFKVGEAVFYGVHGVCTITEITKREFCGEMRDYYTLKPVYSKSSTVFVPVPKDGAPEKLRKTLSKEQVLALIPTLSKSTYEFLPENNVRKEAHATVIKNGSPQELAALVKGLYERRENLVLQHKKLHAADERVLTEAEKMLFEEFAFALGIEREQVPEEIGKIINHHEKLRIL